MRRLFKVGRGSEKFEESGPSWADFPTWLELALGLSGLATGLLALSLAFRNSLVALLFLVGAVVAGLAGAWIFLLHVIRFLVSARRQLETRLEYEYKQRGGDLRYLDDVVSWGRREIGAAHPGTDIVTRRLGENPNVLTVYVRERSNGRCSFCGYVLLYPIKDECAKAILSGEVRAESELGAEPLCESFEGASFLYVGMVLGTDNHARSHVKDKLRMTLIRILTSGNIERVFARPGSRGGLSLMKHYGFLPVGDNPEGIWSTTGAQLKRRLLAEEAMSSAVLVDQASARVDQSGSPISRP